MATLNREITNLDPGKRYIVRVRSTNKLGVSSPWSESIVFEPQESSLGLGGSDLILTPGVKLMIAQWNTPDTNDLDSYRLYASTTSNIVPEEEEDDGGVPPYSTLSGGTLTVINKAYDGSTYEPLEPNTTYYVRLYWVDGDGVSTQIAEEKSVTTSAGDTPFEPVETFFADAIGTGTLTAGVTVSGQIQTATSGARVVLGNYAPGKIGMAAFNEGDDTVLEFDTDTGRLFVAGRIESGYGPNLLTNSGFDTDTDDWAADIGGKMWLFNPNDSIDPLEGWEEGSSSRANLILSHTSEIDETLFGDDGSLRVRVESLTGGGGSAGNGARFRAAIPSIGTQSNGQTASVISGDTHSGTFRIRSVNGPRMARIVLLWYNSAFSYQSSDDFTSDWQLIDNKDDEWSEITFADAVAPVTGFVVPRIEIKATDSVGDLADEDVFLLAYGAIETNNPGTVSRDTASFTDGGLKLVAGAGTSTAPAVSVVHSPPGKTPDGAVEVEAGEFYNARLKFYINQTAQTFLPNQYKDAIILVMFRYDEDRFLGMDFGSGFSDKGNDPGSTNEATTASETFEIPEGTTKIRFGVGFVSTHSSNDYIVIDEVEFRKSSVITSSILRAGNASEPRIEVQASSRPSVHFHPSGRRTDFPGIIQASKDELTIMSPYSASGKVKRAGMKLMAGQTTGSSSPPIYSFDAYPLSFFAVKSNTTSAANDTLTKIGFQAGDKAWDPLNMFSTATDVFTVPGGYRGIWILYADVEWDLSLDDGIRRLALTKNGSPLRILHSITNLGNTGSNRFENGGMTFANLAEGDEIELYGYQNSGLGSVTILEARFGALYLGGSAGD